MEEIGSPKNSKKYLYGKQFEHVMILWNQRNVVNYYQKQYNTIDKYNKKLRVINTIITRHDILKMNE